MKAQPSSLSVSAHRAWGLVALSVLALALAFGCGKDSSNGTNGGATNGNGTGATNGGGAIGGNGAPPFSGAVLCTLVFGEASTGFVRLISDEELAAGEPIDSAAEAIEVGGGVACATRGPQRVHTQL